MNSFGPLNSRKTTPGSRTRSVIRPLHKANTRPSCHQVEQFRNRIDLMDDARYIAQALARFEEVLVKRGMERSGNPDDRFVCEVLAINLGAGCQRMVLWQRSNQLIVPNAVRFQALSAR